MAEQPADGFAELLQRLRRRAGLTQEELARAASVSTRTVSDLERAVHPTARKDTGELLAGALGLTGQEREQFLSAARGKPAEAGRRHDDADASSLVWVERALSGTFVDREKELGFLRQAWSSATAGHRVLALVAGEPGIGKTALTAELARLVSADGGLVLYGRWDEEVLAPYQAFREALADYSRACPEDLLRRDLAGLAGDIARLCPEPAQRIGASAAAPLVAAEAERFRLFESLDTWIGRMGARHPVLFVLDDLQWADQPSFLLLLHLMQARRATPLLAVAMYRDTEVDRGTLPAVLSSLARDIDCRRLPLRGLAPDAVATLLEAVAGRPFGDSESPMVRQLVRDTAGNPFFLREMARHLSEAGAFDRDAGPLGQATAEIPESVREMVRSRLRRVSADCTKALQVASVIGERFDAALVASAASQPDAGVIDLLEEAARAGLIVEINDEPDCWQFSHSLTRRVTSDELSMSRRVRLHQRIAEALESRPGVSAAELGHHFGAAASKDSAQKAVRYERLAGERALDEVAAEVAAGHFSRALDLLDRFAVDQQAPQQEELRCELLLQLAGAHDRAGEYASRDERYTEAADAARRLGNGTLLARAALGYGGILPATVFPDPRAQALLEEALQRLGEEDSGTRATVLARLAHWLHTARPYPQRRELSDRSVAMARGTASPRTLATVLLHRCWALDGPDDVSDALAVGTEILAIGTESADPEVTLEGLRILLAAQFEKGEHAAAASTALQLTTLAQKARHPEFIRLSAMWDIAVANLEGRFTDAEELAAELGPRLARIGHPQARLIPVAQSFPWGVLQGRSAEYIPMLERLSEMEPANASWPAITAWCLAETGSRDKAADLLRRIKPAAAADADKNYQWWAAIVGFSGAVDLVEDREWAEVLYDLAAPYAGHNATLGLASFLGAADHWLGVLARVAGRLADAASHLEAALARHRAMRSRPLTALTQEAYGHLLSIRGQPAASERARTLTQSAMRTASELGLAAIRNRPQLR
jgi:transcriptional regulator with XRE-family HTH domain